jgi:hypothetical protein
MNWGRGDIENEMRNFKTGASSLYGSTFRAVPETRKSSDSSKQDIYIQFTGRYGFDGGIAVF